MSMQYIRDYYKVPAKRGGRILYTYGGELIGQPGEGTIVGAKDQYLRVRFDSDPSRIYTLHPTWSVEYLDALKQDGGSTDG
ncbi:MAG: hypothetical protein GEU78_09580 [Actinobacteria bacterium]|nr:hypothetical protein [Actinomycetota bacterium]